jgi:protein-arginine deiminase
MKLRSPVKIICVVLLASCSSDPPSAALSVTPNSGFAPEKIRLDASASRATDSSKPALLARFDFQGDGTFDTEYSAELSIEHEYADVGNFRPSVEIKDEEGKTAVAAAVLNIAQNLPPLPELTVTPDGGKLPLQVTLDASASTDPNEDKSKLQARFDFQGDGNFDTEFSSTMSAAHLYETAGSFAVVVEVRDSRGLTASRRSKAFEVLPSADIDADTNRNGFVEDDDESGEDSWSREQGAIMLGNFDDDDDDGVRDLGDSEVSGTEDLRDLAPLLVRQYPGLSAMALVSLEVDELARPNIRIFLEDESGSINEVYTPRAASVSLPAERLAAGELRLFVEALAPRSGDWDGLATIALRVDLGGGAIEEDTIAIKTSPIIFPDNNQPGDELFVMKITDRDFGENMPFYDAVAANLPEGMTIYDIDQYEYWGDRWAQDNMQTGYQAMPSDGGIHVMKTYLETERETGAQGLEFLLTRELLGPDLGYVYPGGSYSSLNYGGNLEIAPPLTAKGVEYPFGRVLVGGGEEGTLQGRNYDDHMSAPQRAFLDAQPQGPSVELSTEWLAVGHLDEIFQFVVDHTGNGPHPFKVVFASPVLARQALEELSANGLGDAVVFRGRRPETTVDAILADDELMTYNDAAQARVDSVRTKMMEELDLVDADILEVPVLYERYFFDGFDFAAAYNPGIQNFVTARDTLFIPDPEGPEQNGADVWETLTRAALEPLGVTVQFVDVFESYHEGMGEAHCGTEINHAPYERAWWDAE